MPRQRDVQAMSTGAPPLGTTWDHHGRPLTRDDVAHLSRLSEQQALLITVLQEKHKELVGICEKLANKVEKLQAEAEKARDDANSDTNLLNFVQWHLDNHGTDLANKELRKWGGLTRVRGELERLRSVYNGGIKIPRNKKGDPI